MSHAGAKASTVELDLSDVKRRVGQEVGGKLIEPCSVPLVRLGLKMTNQDDAVLATGKVDVELPR